MKVKLLIFILWLGHPSLYSQTVDEWTRQNKTQRKYLIQQIAALRTYLNYLNKGYQIVQTGISTVQNVRSGEWMLHNDYFNSLLTVKPAIAKYKNVQSTLTIYGSLAFEAAAVTKGKLCPGNLSPHEYQYTKRISEQLLRAAERDINHLIHVTTGGELQMTDHERIQEVNKIFSAIQHKAQLLESLVNEVKVLCSQRTREIREKELSIKLNGVK